MESSAHGRVEFFFWLYDKTQPGQRFKLLAGIFLNHSNKLASRKLKLLNSNACTLSHFVLLMEVNFQFLSSSYFSLKKLPLSKGKAIISACSLKKQLILGCEWVQWPMVAIHDCEDVPDWCWRKSFWMPEECFYGWRTSTLLVNPDSPNTVNSLLM